MGDKGEGEVKNLKKGDVVYRPMIANCFRICHMQNKDRLFFYLVLLKFSPMNALIGYLLGKN